VRRILLWTFGAITLLVVVLVSLVLVRAGGVDALPPPDPALAIEMPGGQSMPLAEVVDRARQGTLPKPTLPPVEPLLGSEPLDIEGEEGPITILERGPFPMLHGVPIVPDDPVYALAEIARWEGRNEQALALYLSIPPDNEHYARSRRIVAWELLARDLDRPEQAVAYANQAVRADPFNGNAWQDWARVYGKSLGLPLH
jgi:tetratricopeptide (TPR) repeat protein